ncbi:MAG: hypothetical protein B0D92_02040 [Spirochaeta sp. LUC14_002_19_P3]|nr:MAG: hypothetical protein B0D92_02040 [Spirochaeta sp. LUC14_002_19_P3]
MKQLFLLATVLLIFACEVFNLSDTQALSISAYTPSETTIKAAELETASVTFSRQPNPSLAEEAFVLTADGIEVSGQFSWLGNTLHFSPFTGWKDGTDYILKVTTAAEDDDGRSLNAEFTHSFSTRAEKDRPTVVSSTPADGAKISTIKPAVTIQFSEAMVPGSVASGFSISPRANGILTWNTGFTVFTYTLSENLKWQTEYELFIPESSTDSQNNTLAEDWNIRFYTGTDTAAPSLQSVSNGAGFTLQPDSLTDTVLTRTTGWETDWSFVLSFSEAMDADSLLGALTFTPNLSYKETWNGSTLTLVPESEANWDTPYSLLVSTSLTDTQGNPLSTEYRYNFQTNGSTTKPPEVVAMVIYTDPTDPTAVIIPSPYTSMSLAKFAPPPQDINFGNTVVDVFLKLAAGAQPNLDSFANNFLIEEDGVNSFVPLAVRQADAAFHPPNIPAGDFGPANPGAAYDTWVRAIVFIDNDDAAKTGLLNITLGGDFTDDKGRAMGTDWTVPIFITD